MTERLERWVWTLIHTVRSLWICVYTWITNNLFSVFSSSVKKQTIVLDTGLSVSIGERIAEGGFSYVFEAFEEETNNTSKKATKYALKRMHCADEEAMAACQKEAQVHRAISHENLLPLYGFLAQEHVCYMLFPYMNNSLRQELNARVLNGTNQQEQKRPYSETMALSLLLQIMRGVTALHDANYSHRDIKLDNVLLNNGEKPVLMDFGSVGPLLQPLDSRRTVLELVEHAAQHTTLPYRPPELLEGGCRAGDDPLDYSKVDVWSLGCTLFAIFFGASPFEVEFERKSGIRIVECGQLRILGNVPKPSVDHDMATWCSQETFELMEWMLTKDRMLRPYLHEVMVRVEELLIKFGGSVPPVQEKQQQQPDNPDSDLDDLLGNSNYV